MKSTQQKIRQLEGLLGTKDINGWESEFITSLVTKLSKSGPDNYVYLTDKQVDTMDRLYQKHFA